MANAFEKPIKADRGGGYLEPSILRFAEYWNNVKTAYGLDDEAAILDVQKVIAVPDEKGASKKEVKRNSIFEMQQWIQQDGR